MKIKILKNVKVNLDGYKTSLEQGSNYDLEDSQAEYLIRNGFAEKDKAKKEKKKEEPKESAE